MRTSPPTHPIGVGHIHPMSVRSKHDDCESAPTGQRPTRTAKALPPRPHHVDLLTGASWLHAQSRRLVAPSRRCLTNGQRITHQACATTFGRPLFRVRTLLDTHEKKPRKRGFRGRQSEDYLAARVPTTSISTRRFFARPSEVLLSATGCFSPLPSV